MNYLVYILKSENHTYIGMTNDFFRRWKQHNKILKGGAKATSRRENWSPICIIDGFLTLKEACQCEWAIKHHKKRHGAHNKILNLQLLWDRGYWTSKSPFVKEQSLTIYIDSEYKESVSMDTNELYWK
mgnify:CR=1 FL=1